MKALRIPEHKINNAYLLVGEEPAVLSEACMHFIKTLFLRDVSENRESILLRIENGSHPDILRITADKPEDNPHIISVDNIRNRVTDTVGIRPYEARYKVYLIEGAEKMNIQAQNALLKTLEEPPEYVIIILLSQNADGFLPTIMSRVMELKAGERDPREKFSELYREEWARETVRFLVEIRFRSAGDILAYIKKRSEEKVDTALLYSFIEIILRDVLCYKSTSKEELLYGQEIREEISRMSRDISYVRLGELTEEIQRGIRGLSVNVNRDLQLENFLLRMKK